MKSINLSLLVVFVLLLTGCTAKNPCLEGSVTYLESASEFPPDTSASLPPQKTDIEIKGKTVTVDRIIEGPMCNDTWEGTIYVACDLTVQKWDIKPFFFSNGCNLEIKPDTVVYVAAHNNAAYYKGCITCH